MLNLLKSDLKALFKWKATIYAILAIFVLSASSILLNISYDDPALGSFFELAYVNIMIISVIIGLFVYRDYSQNTIRNKIVVGHSRVSIFVAKTITILTMFLSTALVQTATALIIGSLFGDLDYIDWAIFAQNCAVYFVTIVVVTAMVSLIAVNIQSPIGAMLPMMLLFFIMFSGMIVLEMFMVNENTAMIELFQTTPILNLLTLVVTEKPFDLLSTCVMGAAMFLTMELIGMLIFKKLDLK